jgi:hypothetical protein
MSLYSQGHKPFALRGIVAEEEMTAKSIRDIAHERSLEIYLNSAYEGSVANFSFGAKSDNRVSAMR